MGDRGFPKYGRAGRAGYMAGKYFTRSTLATQLEYRFVLPKRFGLVVFGGLGGVIPAGSQLLQMIQSSHFLPSGGGDCDLS
jgi:hypothetical protein